MVDEDSRVEGLLNEKRPGFIPSTGVLDGVT